MAKKIVGIGLLVTLVVTFVLGLQKFTHLYLWAQDHIERIGKGYIPSNLPDTGSYVNGYRVALIDFDLNYTDGAHNLVPVRQADGSFFLIGNSYRSDALLKYECTVQADSITVQRAIIDENVGEGGGTRSIKVLTTDLILGFIRGAHYTAFADLNNDNQKDLIVAGDFKTNDIVWYKRRAKNPSTSEWEKHTIYRNDSHRTYHIETGDINGDHNLDILFSTKTDNSVGVVINQQNAKKWLPVIIDQDCPRAFNVRAADFDNDSMDEIIASEDNKLSGGKLHLYNYNPISKSFEKYIIGHLPIGHGASIFEIVDINHDGNPDIVLGNHQGDIYRFINPTPASIFSTWDSLRVNYTPPFSRQDFREIDVGDIDNDGDMDIVVADELNNGFMWIENESSITWRAHPIDYSDEYLRWCHSVELSDIDLNGFLDVAVAAAGSNTFLAYFDIGKPIIQGD